MVSVTDDDVDKACCFRSHNRSLHHLAGTTLGSSFVATLRVYRTLGGLLRPRRLGLLVLCRSRREWRPVDSITSSIVASTDLREQNRIQAGRLIRHMHVN